MNDQLDTFDTRLLAELREHVSDRGSRLEPHDTPRRLLPHRGWAAAAGVAAAAVAGVILLPGLGAEPAYSVTEGNAGQIIVQVNRPENAAGLERQLAEHGIDSDVTYVPGDQQCAPGRYTPIADRRGLSMALGTAHVQVTVEPGAVQRGETLVLSLSVAALTDEEIAELDAGEPTRVADGFRGAVDLDVTAGPVGPCRPVPTQG